MDSYESDDSGYDSPCSSFDYDKWKQEQLYDLFQAMNQFSITVALAKHDQHIIKTITKIDPNWRTAIGAICLTKPVSKIQVRRTGRTQTREDTQPADILRGLLTGERNGITVVDTKRDSAFYRELPTELLNATLKVDTPNRGVHLYFKYDFRLKSIYETLKGVSVYSDDRYVLIGGPSYPTSNKLNPIIAMPETMFKALYDAQEAPAREHKACAEVFAILDDDWFDDKEQLRTLITDRDFTN